MQKLTRCLLFLRAISRRRKAKRILYWEPTESCPVCGSHVVWQRWKTENIHNVISTTCTLKPCGCMAQGIVGPKLSIWPWHEREEVE